MTIEQFNKLSPKQQRIHVAKDVVAQIKLKRYKAVRQNYVRISGTVDKTLLKSTENNNGQAELCTLVDKVHCEVCARGALFMSAVKFGNEFKIAEFRGGLRNWFGDEKLTPYYIRANKVGEKLTPVFGVGQQCMIETAFELRDINEELWAHMACLEKDDLQREEHNITYLYKTIKNACIKFGKRYKTVESRLLGIMHNIIKNKGVFQPM